MQTKATKGNSAIRVRAALLLACSAAALVLPAVWRPATSATPGDPTGLVVVAAGWAAWALTIYLAAGTGAVAAGHLAGSPGSWGRFSPSVLRRFVEVAIGASSAAAVCLAPAVAYADAPAPGPVASASPLDWPGLTAAPPAPAHQPVVAATKPQPHVAQPAHRLVVRRGDSLWSLTARQLGPGATPARIAAGWPLLYAANRHAIGADPNLIRPGQQLVPPPAEGRTSP
jgi:nucleoid-associated protein YgaU